MINGQQYVDINPDNWAIKTAVKDKFTLKEFAADNVCYLGEQGSMSPVLSKEELANAIKDYVQTLCLLFFHVLLGQVYTAYGIWFTLCNYAKDPLLQYGFDPYEKGHIPNDLLFL